jgi:hypothetical protein
LCIPDLQAPFEPVAEPTYALAWGERLDDAEAIELRPCQSQRFAHGFGISVAPYHCRELTEEDNENEREHGESGERFDEREARTFMAGWTSPSSGWRPQPSSPEAS